MRFIIRIIILLLILLANDGLYYLKRNLESKLEQYEQHYQENIGTKPAVIILKGGDSERIISAISSLYYVQNVKVTAKEEIIEMLAEQYQLTDSEELLRELRLPQVLEVNFSGKKFSRVESGLFLQTLQALPEVERLLYAEENFAESWQILETVKQWRDLLFDNWHYLYYGFGFIFLLAVFYLRLNEENSRLLYWKVYERSGGDLKYKRVRYIINGILEILLPVAAVFILESYLHKGGILPDTPHLVYHLIRLPAAAAVSLSIVIIQRKSIYV